LTTNRAGLYTEVKVDSLSQSDSLSPKRSTFKRLAERRTNAVLQRIRVLSHCSNKYAYEYSEADVERIFGAIEKELDSARMRFSGKQAVSRFTLADQ
jgi:CHASE1-domain containing sensor protein